MSTALVSPRQGLNTRQAETVERLLVAGQELLEQVGADDLTVRAVAGRAGVSPATAYTYLASKNHLFAEIFLRHIAASPLPPLSGGRPDRVRQVSRHLSDVVFATTHIAAAANIALLSHDPDVERLRLRIGAELAGRFRTALGDSADPGLLDALMFAFAGAMLQAGMGVFGPTELAERFDAVAAAIMKGHR